MTEFRLALLFSGNGSNAEVLAKNFHNKQFSNTKTKIALAICNKKDAFGIERLSRLNIKTTIIEHKNFSNREEFDRKLVEKIRGSHINLARLAGFMRILSPVFTDNIDALNIHPSLLPLHKGANGMRDSFLDSMRVAGVSVHRVNSELDSGEIVAQECLQKIDGEEFASFKLRVHMLEHKIYTEAVKKVLGIL